MTTRLQNLVPRRRLLLAGSSGIALASLPMISRGDSWPSRTIRIVCAQAPGASTDATARSYSEFLTEKLGVSVVVENRPGAMGMIAAENVARSAPDGTTFLVTLHSQLAQSSVLVKRPPLDPGTDLIPIVAMSTGRSPGVVHKGVAAKTFAEVVALARKRPVTVGNYSIGSGWQMQMTKVAEITGAQFDIINYRGTGPMQVDLLAGQIDMGAGSLAGLGQAIARGDLRPVVLITGKTNAKLPGLQSWADAGFVGPAFQNLREYNMMLAPAGTPAAITDRLAKLIVGAQDTAPRIRQLRETLVAEDIPLLAGADLKAMIAEVWPTYQTETRALNLEPV